MSLRSETLRWNDGKQAEYLSAQEEALKALYDATNGPGWKVDKDWKFRSGADIGEWSGVTRDSDGRVIKLCLSDIHMDGQLPEELANLQYLERLELNNNRLWGPIPEGLGKLENLRYIDLSANDLTGSIPDLHALSELEALDLSYNRLSGAISPSISQLRKLTKLDLTDNQLSERVPSLGALNNLTTLNLGYNHLAGPIPQIPTLRALERLDLSNNEFSGTIDSRIGKLNQLKVLNLANNKLSGSIPRELVNLRDIEHIEVLPGNRFDDSMPRELAGPDLGLMKERRVLISLYEATDGKNWVSGNTEAGETSIDNTDQPNRELNTNWCVMAPVCSWYGIKTNEDGFVEELNLPFNNLSGTLPPDISGLSHLKHLILRGNQLQGSIPDTIGDLSELQTLDLGENDLSGSIPDKLFDLVMLRTLYLDTNSLEGNLSEEFESLFNLQLIDLSSNEFEGPIPVGLASLADLAHLERLSLSDNNLSGSIPSELFQGRLTCLDLSHNELSEFDLKLSFDPSQNQIEYLDLSHNQLTCPIPSGLVSCSWSHDRHSHGARLTGSNYIFFDRGFDLGKRYPSLVVNGGHSFEWVSDDEENQRLWEEYDRISSDIKEAAQEHYRRIWKPVWPTEAQYVDLSNNNLCGQMPTDFFVHSLRHLNLGNNQLVGCIDSNIGQLTNIEYLDLSNNGLSGEVLSVENTVLADGASEAMNGLSEVELNEFEAELNKTSTFSHLRHLDLSHNRFEGDSGALFDVLVGNSKHLDLSDNQFEGKLPGDLLYSSYAYVDLSNNRLQGSVWFSPVTSTGMRWLDLTGNNIDGLDRGMQVVVLEEFMKSVFNMGLDQYMLDSDFVLKQFKGSKLDDVIDRLALDLDFSADDSSELFQQMIPRLSRLADIIVDKLQAIVPERRFMTKVEMVDTREFW